MTGYLILGSIILLALAFLAVYFIGRKHGKQGAEAAFAVERSKIEADRVAQENARQKEEKDYREKSGEIKQEVNQNAETQKAELSSHADAGDRFNAINASLRQPAGSNKN
ncbi:hypothetical protein AGMMS49944_15730 [Spirochaetia bacterium]|nr:hypothetical protein AGMMS49944_15730 [Spirochaetia bacterium]